MRSFSFTFNDRKFHVLPYKFPFYLEIEEVYLKFEDDSGKYEINPKEIE